MESIQTSKREKFLLMFFYIQNHTHKKAIIANKFKKVCDIQGQYREISFIFTYYQ